MKTTIWLLVSIVAISVASTMGQTPICSSFGTIDPNDVPKLPDQYQLRIEIKSVVEKSIRETHFFYDAPNKRAMMRYVQNNMVTRLIYNYAQNEIYKIDETVEPPFDIYDPPDGRPLYPSVCQTYKLNESPMLNFFGFSMLQPESAVPGAPEQVIRFFPQKKGEKVVVGPMVCNQFLSCQYDAFYNANFTAEHFFSDGSFSFAGQTDTYKYIPFRAIFKGVYQILGSTRNMEIIHDYHDFEPSVPDRVFEIPTTVWCVDRKPTVNMPPVSDSYYFSQEITSPSFEKTISLTLRDVYTFGKLLTYKYRNHVSQPATLNSTEPHQYIVDRSLGVQYAINMNSNACRIRGTSRFVPSNSDPYNPALDFISHLEEWNGFLPSRTEFTYHGERKFQGIMSNRFTGQVNSTIVSGPNEPIVTYSSIFEYAFSQPSIPFYNLDQEEKNIPVALLIKSDQGEMFSTRSSFYNFESSPSAYRRFDVSPCYDPEDVIHFDLVFPYQEQFTAEELNQVPYLERTIYNLLYVTTAQPVVRFAYPKVTISTDGNLYARSAIFPLPPAETMFTFEGNFLLLVGTLNSSFRINTTEDCMRFCLTNRKCRSVDYNPTSNTCYLNPNTTASGAQQTTSLAYQHWRRNGEGLDLAEGFEVYYILNSLVEEGSVAINFLDGKVGIGKTSDSKEGPDTVPRAKVLFAEKVNIVSTTNNRFGTTALLSRFNLKRSRTRLQTQKTVLTKVGVSVDDCARLCVDKVGSECLTFGYCYLSADCIISTYALNDYQENELIADDHCDVYEKDPLLHYERLFIRTTIDKKDKKFASISTASECASKCDNEKSIHCRSFNFCGRDNLCYLSEAHLLDATAGSNAVDNLTCEHYSRNYITDFTYVNTGEVKLDAEIVLRDADLNSCSTTCVSSKSFNCKTFDYCPESKTCLLNSGEKQVLSNVQAAKEQCAHYRREYYYTTSQSYNYRSSGGSDTVLIVLSILFSILSVAGGVVGTLFVFKKYNLK